MTSCINNPQSNSTLSKPPISPVSPINTDNQVLDQYQFVWLDPDVNTDAQNQATYDTLQRMVTYVRTFNDCSLCEQWLKNYYSEVKIILIVSGGFGKTIVPLVHDLESIISIYIYCLKRERYEEWSKQYAKIHGIVTVTNDLIQQLSSCQNDFENMEDSKAIQIIRINNLSNDSSSSNASFMWYQLLLQILVSSIYLPQRDTFSKLTEVLHRYCANNLYNVASVEEFRKTYEPKQAPLWLMNETPVKRLISKALREQDIQILFLLRFFLSDVHLQLTTRSSITERVYKLQPMPLDTIKCLQESQNQYLFFPGFLSASRNKPDLNQINMDHNQCQTVLIEITANRRSGTWPFACIDDINVSFSDYCSNNVLFMCGSIFQIGLLKQIKNYMWTLQLTLASAKELSTLIKMRRQLRRNRNLCLIGDLLETCDPYDKAIVYYKSLLRELPANHTLMPSLKERLKRISDIKRMPLINFQFILVDLSTRLTPLAAALLNALNQVTNKTILIFDDESDIDWQQFSDKTIYLFTSSQAFNSLNTSIRKNLSVFILESDPNKINHRQRLATSEDLICQLADEIYRCYAREALRYSSLGNLKKAKDTEIFANRIHSALRTTHKKMIAIENNNQSFVRPKTELIWLKSKSQGYVRFQQENKDIIEIVEFYSNFNNQDNCQKYICNDNNVNDIFLIIDADYEGLIRDELIRSKNIKRFYYYGSSTLENKVAISNSTNLRYRLTHDLMIHYSDLGALCRTKSNAELARDMFSRAKKLCDILAEF